MIVKQSSRFLIAMVIPFIFLPVFALFADDADNLAPPSLDPPSQTDASVPSEKKSPVAKPSVEPQKPTWKEGDIVARQYETEVKRLSESKKTSLLSTNGPDVPRVGHIILLKKGTEPVMGLRVLKNYPDKKEFIAKRIKRYSDRPYLELSERYTALEKIADLPPPPPTAQDQADIHELEGDPTVKVVPPAKAYDPELDAAMTPKPEEFKAEPKKEEKNRASAPADDNSFIEEGNESDESDELLGAAYEETQNLDLYRSWLGLAIANLRNYDSELKTAYYTGAGIQYGYSVSKMLFAKSPQLQDSLTPELGVFLYKISNFTKGTNDSYTVIPVRMAVRYNLHFADSFTAFLNFGAMINRVAGFSENYTGEAITALNTISPIVGGGIIFTLGPQWNARVDLGLDMIGGGIVLRF